MIFFPLVLAALGVAFGFFVLPRLYRRRDRTTLVFGWIVVALIVLLIVARNVS